MGKSSKAQRLRAVQSTESDKAWCDHCLGVLHDTGLSALAEGIVEEYRDMRSGFQIDRRYSHAEAMEQIEGEVAGILQALRSSGDRYHYELGLETRSESGLSHDEWREYVAVKLRLGEISQEQADEWLRGVAS